MYGRVWGKGRYQQGLKMFNLHRTHFRPKVREIVGVSSVDVVRMSSLPVSGFRKEVVGSDDGAKRTG